MTTKHSKLWYLKQVNLFNGMPPEMAVKVEEMTEMKSFAKGEKIYLGVDPAKHIFILKEGRVKVSQESGAKRELIKAILYPGEIFGETGLSGAESYMDEATALDEDVLVCTMDVKYMEMLMKMHPSLGLAVTASIGKKLEKMERKLESLIFKDAYGRVLELLLRMVSDHGKSSKGDTILLEHNLTQQDLANLAATSRQTVTTILNEFQEDGLIRMERKKIFVNDIDALRGLEVNPA